MRWRRKSPYLYSLRQGKSEATVWCWFESAYGAPLFRVQVRINGGRLRTFRKARLLEDAKRVAEAAIMKGGLT